MPGHQFTFLAAAMLLGSGLFLANHARAGATTVGLHLQMRFVDADLVPLAIDRFADGGLPMPDEMTVVPRG